MSEDLTEPRLAFAAEQLLFSCRVRGIAVFAIYALWSFLAGWELGPAFPRPKQAVVLTSLVADVSILADRQELKQLADRLDLALTRIEDLRAALERSPEPLEPLADKQLRAGLGSVADPLVRRLAARNLASPQALTYLPVLSTAPPPRQLTFDLGTQVICIFSEIRPGTAEIVRCSLGSYDEGEARRWVLRTDGTGDVPALDRSSPCQVVCLN